MDRSKRLYARAAPYPDLQIFNGQIAHRTPVEIGPFRVTPYLVDHSAFDAYALLVEADGKRVFYSGDFRGHGRKRKLSRR